MGQHFPPAEMACASPIRCCKISQHARVPQSQLPYNARVVNQQVQVHVRCRTRVHRGRRTVNRRLTMPTISQRGSHSKHAQTSFLDTWRTLPTVHHPSLHLIRSSSPSQHVEGAEAANSLLTRDRLPLVRKMSYRTIHPKKSDTRERFFLCLLRRGVLSN